GDVNPQLAIQLTVQTGMMESRNLNQIDSRYFSVISGRQPMSKWTEQNGQRFLDELDQLYLMVGQQIVDELLGDPHNMIDAADRALEKNRYQLTAWASRGVARVKVGDYQGGLDDLERAIAINGMLPNHYLWRARARYFLQDYRGSIEDYDLVMDLASPTIDPRWLIGRAVGKARLGDLDGAIDDCSRALSLDYYSEESYLVRAALFFQKKNPRDGASDVQTADVLRRHSASK